MFLGFLGDKNSYDNLQSYMQKVGEYEIKDFSDYKISRGVKKVKEFQSISSISQNETKSKTIDKPSASNPDLTAGNSADWLHQLRATINAALSKPASSWDVISTSTTKEYDRIIQNDIELEKKIKSIELEPAVEKKIIPKEEVFIFIVVFNMFSFYFLLLPIKWINYLAKCAKDQMMKK